MKTLIASTAQMNCQDGKTEDNLEHASFLVEKSVRQNSQLILFPEFMPTGYRLTQEIWDSAELFDGPTTDWLCNTARLYNVYIGTSFLEMRAGDFINTFALASPSGKIEGKVHKRHPSMWEAYFFRGSEGLQYIDTEIGRIGVGICFDNHTFDVANAISACKIDLMLMPHSYCTPSIVTKMSSQADIDRLNGLPTTVATLYNKWFGVPVIMCNKSGTWNSPVPNRILGIPQNFQFSGRSVILDSDGALRNELGVEESVGTALIKLDPDLKKTSEIKRYSRYIYPGPAGREIIRLMEWRGRMSYRFSRKRREKARQLQVKF
jgi:N-carbamoylputrescine amidase